MYLRQAAQKLNSKVSAYKQQGKLTIDVQRKILKVVEQLNGQIISLERFEDKMEIAQLLQ